MRTKTVLFLISFLVLSFLSISYARTVIVKPGGFDHFVLQIPERIIAGENFVIRVQVYDSHNNLITNFPESGKEFKVVMTGSANVQPSYLGSASFSGGVVNVTVTDKKAEVITFSIYEEGGTVPVISKGIIISPNKLDYFEVQVPDVVTAGNEFSVRVIAKDIFGNAVSDMEMVGKNIKITSIGALSLKETRASVPDFKNGAISIGFTAERIGNVAIEVREGFSGSKGRSRDIVVTPAVLSYFKVNSPKEAVAGEPFKITIEAYDRYGNLVNYSSSGGGVMLQSTRQSRIEPSLIKPSAFQNNEAVVNVIYEKAEEIAIIAKEQNKTQEGKSNPININSARADHFAVITPDTAVSGKTFKIKIEAYDRYNNLVRNYNLTGSDVVIHKTGSGILAPTVISPSEFNNGIAIVEVVYDKAESFAITATMAPPKTGERINTKDRKSAEAKGVSKTAQSPNSPKIEKKEKTEFQKEVIEKKNEEIKVTKKEEPKKEELKKEITKKPFSINNVSIVNEKKKDKVVIAFIPSDENLEFTNKKELIYGKEWLKLSLKPAIKNTKSSMKLKSQFIGDVLIEEDKNERDALNIYIELMPAVVVLDIARDNNSLVVSLSQR